MYSLITGVCVMFQIVFSQSVTDYSAMLDTFKLQEFEKECIITLPEGCVINMMHLTTDVYEM